MAYVLGPVRPHVKEAANHFGPKHGIKVVYGFRPVGSVPTSDHPKGLALDFMTTDRNKGDALADDIIANASAYNVTYVIWWKRIWQVSSGWKTYTGTNNPHIDHVHASFGDAAGSGNVSDVQGVGNPLVPDSIEQIYTLFQRINERIQWITAKESWMRIGAFMIGVILVLIAVLSIIGKTQVVQQTVSKAVKKGVNSGK